MAIVMVARVRNFLSYLLVNCSDVYSYINKHKNFPFIIKHTIYIGWVGRDSIHPTENSIALPYKFSERGEDVHH